MKKTSILTQKSGLTFQLLTMKRANSYKSHASVCRIVFCWVFPILIAAQAVPGNGNRYRPERRAHSESVTLQILILRGDNKPKRQGVYTSIIYNREPDRTAFTGQGFQTLVLNDVQIGIGRTETRNGHINHRRSFGRPYSNGYVRRRYFKYDRRQASAMLSVGASCGIADSTPRQSGGAIGLQPGVSEQRRHRRD